MTVVMKLHMAGQTPSVAVQGAHLVVVYGVVGVGVITVWIHIGQPCLQRPMPRNCTSTGSQIRMQTSAVQGLHMVVV